MPQASYTDGDVKEKVRTIVRNYEDLFSSEFADFKRSIAVTRSKQRTKFAEARGTDFVQRKLYEVPATLWAALQTRMTEDEMAWFKSKEGGRWFALSFPAYRVTEKV